MAAANRIEGIAGGGRGAGSISSGNRISGGSIKATQVKQAIPSKIKTPTQSYDIKQTPTGIIKATNTKTGITVSFPKGTKLNINKIKSAHAQKFLDTNK
jgi:hypothetical protein